MLKWVLVGTCNFVSKHTGKTRVHPDTVAEWCEINKAQTVSDAQQELASKGLLVDIGERIGRNGQTIVWTPGWKKHSHATDTPLTTDSHATDTPLTPPNVASYIGKVGTEPNNLITINHKPYDNNALGNSLAACEQPSPAKSSVSVFECYQNHIKWPEFAAHAKRLGKPPTPEWFKRWLAKQKPQWRNKKSSRQEVLEEIGYTLDGKFYTSAEAIGLGLKDPNLIEKFRPVTRRNGKVIASKCSRTTAR
jgi:arsenate reductase-like glutaredoxin family protein